MTIIAPTNGHDPVADHPVIIDMQTKITMIFDIVTRMDERHAQMAGHINSIVEYIAARGDTGAIKDG